MFSDCLKQRPQLDFFYKLTRAVVVTDSYLYISDIFQKLVITLLSINWYDFVLTEMNIILDCTHN